MRQHLYESGDIITTEQLNKEIDKLLDSSPSETRRVGEKLFLTVCWILLSLTIGAVGVVVWKILEICLRG